MKQSVEYGWKFSNFVKNLNYNFDRKKISSDSVFKALLNSGILLRRMSIYNIKNSLRVTIGNTIENKKFISKIKKLCDV